MTFKYPGEPRDGLLCDRMSQLPRSRVWSIEAAFAQVTGLPHACVQSLRLAVSHPESLKIKTACIAAGCVTGGVSTGQACGRPTRGVGWQCVRRATVNSNERTPPHAQLPGDPTAMRRRPAHMRPCEPKRRQHTARCKRRQYYTNPATTTAIQPTDNPAVAQAKQHPRAVEHSCNQVNSQQVSPSPCIFAASS